MSKNLYDQQLERSDMKINRVTLQNFMSYAGEEELVFENMNIIVGPNGAGKTNIARAIDKVMHFILIISNGI